MVTSSSLSVLMASKMLLDIVISAASCLVTVISWPDLCWSRGVVSVSISHRQGGVKINSEEGRQAPLNNNVERDELNHC